MDRALAKLGPGPKKSFKIEKKPEKVSARSVPVPAKKSVPARARFSTWFSDAPPKPWTHGPKTHEPREVQEHYEGEEIEVEEDYVIKPQGSASYAFFKEENVPVLDEKSRKKILEICQGRLGSLVIRRVKTVMTSKGKTKYVLHSPESHRVISAEEYQSLDDVTKSTRVETFFEGSYSFVTSKKNALPTHDVFSGRAIFGDHKGRSQFDPCSLRLELAPDSPMPRASRGKNSGQDDPYSLVCGVVSKDPSTKKLIFTRWAVISVQEQRAILSILEPDVIHPIRKDEVRTNPDVFRAWLLGGGRLSTNAFRRRVLSEQAQGGSVPEHLYTRYIGSSWGLHHCHILSFWVLLCRYGEMPCKGNIPPVVPAPKPKDPEKAKFYFEDKPLTWWDLPYLRLDQETPKKGKSSKKERKRLDKYVLDKYELKTEIKKVRIPVHRRAACAKEFYPEIPLREQEGKNDIAELLLSSKTAEDSDTETETSGIGVSSDVIGTPPSSDLGLSSDTETPRSETPSEEFETVAAFKRPDWATVVEDAEEMDFDAPLEWSKD